VLCCPLPLLLLPLLLQLLTGKAKLAAAAPATTTAATTSGSAASAAPPATAEVPKPAAKIEEAKKLDGEINGTPAATAATDAAAIDDSTAAAGTA
jgi:hypothetical protein